MHSSALLTIEGLSVGYDASSGPVRAVDGISCSIGIGESIALLGASGSGKTSIALALMRRLPRTARVAGRITLSGTDLLQLSESDLRRLCGAQIALVVQEPVMALHPTRRVGDQVGDVLAAHRSLPRRERTRRVVSLFEEVGLSAAMMRRYAHELSGGERQRVAIAQALACDPRFVVMDEPFAALDAVTQSELLQLIGRLRRGRDMALLFITHDPSLLTGLVDRVLVLSRGTIVEDGRTRRVLTAPSHEFTQAIVEIARRRTVRPAAAAAVVGAPVMRLTDVTSRRVPRQAFLTRQKPTIALEDVSLSVARGEVLGVVGRSGAGKSTLARIMAALDRPSAGQVWIDGVDATAAEGAARRACRRKVQLVMQEPASAFSPRMTVEQIVTEPIAIARRLRPEERTRQAARLLDRVHLPASFAQRYANELSGGQRQRLAIARALAAEPLVLVIDEGFAGLDLPTQEQLLELLGGIKPELGIVFISHDLLLTSAIADRVAVLAQGRIVEELVGRDLLAEPRHAATRELARAVPCPPDVAGAFAVA